MSSTGDRSFKKLIEIGIALSAERDHNLLMEMILQEAKELYNADAGTLYLRGDDDTLRFEIMLNDSKPELNAGGTSKNPVPAFPIRLYDPKTGEANMKNLASRVALDGDTINIPDAYKSKDFDFSGAKGFDKKYNYRSTSFLTVPMKNHSGDVIGVLQLINAKDTATEKVIPFNEANLLFIEAVTSQAAMALDNQNLIQAQKILLDSFISVLAGAIDAKSPYTGGHCQRMPELAMMLAEAANKSNEGIFKDFSLNEEEHYEMNIAALLHDCGKVTTPEYVVDKATKLETIYDRIHEVRTRFEVLKRDAEIDCLNAIIAGGDEKKLRQELAATISDLDDKFAFIANANIGGEYMSDEDIERIEEIGEIEWIRTLDDRIGVSHEELRRMETVEAIAVPAREKLLVNRPEHIIERDAANKMPDDNPLNFKMKEPEAMYNRGEVYNLIVRRGTLTDEERYKINHHMVQTVSMLSQLPFPRHLKNVPEYAGAHHETMVGTGYPRGLKKEDMSINARIMAIADIFEALTACDRPYKKAKTLSESVRILSFMKLDKHIDPDIFELFLKSGVYLEYAEKRLMPSQIDHVEINQFLEDGLG